MSFSTSIHDVKQLAASTVWEPANKCSAHLTINFEGSAFEDHGSVTFYMSDAVLNARLIEAINRIVAERKTELSAEKQAVSQ